MSLLRDFVIAKIKQITPYITYRNTLSIFGVLNLSSLFLPVDCHKITRIRASITDIQNFARQKQNRNPRILSFHVESIDD